MRVPDANRSESPIWKHGAGTLVDGVPEGSGGNGGTVSIYPGRIVLRMHRLTVYFYGVTEVVHTNRAVRVRFAWGYFPWVNVSLLLEGEERTVAAMFPCIFYRSLLRALHAAGFEVHSSVARSHIHGIRT